MITTQQIDLIRQSWSRVLPIRQQAGILFYERLFAIAPELRPLFPNDIQQQAGKLIGMLGMVVASLDQLEELLPRARALAIRHNDYGVEPEHYSQVGEALFWTLKFGLGKAWTDDTRQAWANAYDMLASAMIEAQEAATSSTIS